MLTNFLNFIDLVKKFFVKNKYIFFELYFLLLYLFLLCFFIYFYESFLIFLKFFLTILQKLYSGDLLCEILGLLEDDSDFNKNKTYKNNYMFFPNYIRYVKNFEHFYNDTWLNLYRDFYRWKPYRLTAQNFPKGAFNVYHFIGSNSGTPNFTVWGSSTEGLTDYKENLIQFRSSKKLALDGKENFFLGQKGRVEGLLPRLFPFRFYFPLVNIANNCEIYLNQKSSKEKLNLDLNFLLKFENFFYNFSSSKTDNLFKFVNQSGSFYKYLGEKPFNKNRSYFEKWLNFNWPIQNSYFFPHYPHILLSAYSGFWYLYYKEKSYFLKNWNDYSKDFNFNTFTNEAIDDTPIKTFSFFKKLPNFNLDLSAYANLELYKFYALDEDMFKFVHNYYKEIIRPYSLKYEYFSFYDFINYKFTHYYQNIKFSYLFDNLRKNYTHYREFENFIFYNEIYDNESDPVTHLQSIWKRGYSYFLQESILKKRYTSYRRDFNKNYRYAMNYKNWHLTTWFNFFEKKKIKNLSRARIIWWLNNRKLRFRNWNIGFSVPYWSNAYPLISKFYEYYKKDLREKFGDVWRPYGTYSTIQIGTPKNRNLLLHYAVRDFINPIITKESDFYEIDPTVMGIAGLIELSLSLKRLRRAILKNENYFYRLESHFHEYQLKWMWICNDLINQKLKSRDAEDILGYFRKKRKSIQVQRRDRERVKLGISRRIWQFSESPIRFSIRTRLYKNIIIENWSKKHKLKIAKKFTRFQRTKLGLKRHILLPYHMKKKWRAVIDYDRASNFLFDFLENPKKQFNRRAFVRAIENYYYSLKTFIRICWKKKMGRDLPGFKNSKDFRYYYNFTRISCTERYKGLVQLGNGQFTNGYLFNKPLNYLRLYEYHIGNDFQRTAAFEKFSSLYKRHKTKGSILIGVNPPFKVFGPSVGENIRFRKIKLKLSKFYKRLNLILASRGQDEPFYGLGIQHLFTRIARELTLIEIPRYRKSDYCFTSWSFRYLNFRQEFKWIITKYLNYFTDAEIEKVWSEFDIEIINGHFNLQRMNFFLNFLRELFFNKLNDYLYEQQNKNYLKLDKFNRGNFDDSKTFISIWKYYKIILFDTLFINYLYDISWNSDIHTDKEVVIYEIKKHLGEMQNDFIKILFEKNFPSYYSIKLLHNNTWAKKKINNINYLNFSKMLFINMNKNNFNSYINYFIPILYKYSALDHQYSIEYKTFFKMLNYANLDFAKRKQQMHLIKGILTKYTFHTTPKNRSFIFFRKIYKTFEKSLKLIDGDKL